MKISQNLDAGRTRARKNISACLFYFISFSGAESAHVSPESAKRKISDAEHTRKKKKTEHSESKERLDLRFLNQKIFLCYLHSSEDSVGILMKEPSHFRTRAVCWTQLDCWFDIQLVPEPGLVSWSGSVHTFTKRLPSSPVMALHLGILMVLDGTGSCSHLSAPRCYTHTHTFQLRLQKCPVLPFLHSRLARASQNQTFRTKS